MKPLRVAIIGFGKIAADQHVPSIESNPRFQLAGTSSREGKGPQPNFTDWRELIRSVDGLDAVAITTPPSVRYDIARECLEAGLHCLLEKPPSVGLADIHDLACLAEAKGLTLYTTWHSQHSAGAEAAGRALAGKRVAKMEVRWQEDVHKWHPGQQWIWEPGGFGVFDPAINAFSILTRIIPDGIFVKSADLAFPSNAHTPVAGEIAFTSPAADGPMTCHLDFLRKEGEDWTIEITTTDGLNVRLERGGSDLFLNGERQDIDSPGEYPGIYREFADLLDERRSSVDVAPLRLVADCLLVARRTQADPIFM
ncbi:Gfo/Idh/MocA family oxidoreductase [Sphingomonas piscis]|uniref:Gfo/Idh/MocA family oxidoreductase n=1 Tax=Sphingomonas piscis TaxID=2714943 RepID=A0A6G7YPW7_9SPHN|nr:Gfo/Idh/MocA family oxidoreductase [Sphingomonas piscis]QIK78781.1 Gfo/Idh/MocA family oxidoreductase [Sphingomonas piscis]